VLFQLLQSGITFYRGEENTQALLEFFRTHMTSYALRFHDWQKYNFGSTLHYTRNLVEDSDDFEMIVLNWQPGQASRIHDHNGSHCFMVVLQGEIFEQRFLQKADDGLLISETQAPTAAPGPCPQLQEISKAQLRKPGDFSYIHDKIALHIIGNESNSPAVTLHVYSPPITKLKLFHPVTNETQVRTPGFFSVHGRKTGKS
jgi:cysteine dioxygenase